MAGFLSLFNGPERLNVAEGYWVDVKKSLTAADYEAAQRVLLGKMTMSGEGFSAEPDSVAYQGELVALSILDWNLTDEEGVALQLTPDSAKRESILRLPQSVFLEVYKHVNEASALRGKKDETKFRPGSAGDDAGREARSTVAAEVPD